MECITDTNLYGLFYFGGLLSGIFMLPLAAWIHGKLCCKG